MKIICLKKYRYKSYVKSSGHKQLLLNLVLLRNPEVTAAFSLRLWRLHFLHQVWWGEPPLRWQAQPGHPFQNRLLSQDGLPWPQHLCQQSLLGWADVHQPVVHLPVRPTRCLCLQPLPKWWQLRAWATGQLHLQLPWVVHGTEMWDCGGMPGGLLWPWSRLQSGAQQRLCVPAIPTPCWAVSAPLGCAGNCGRLCYSAGPAGPQPHSLQPVSGEEVKGPKAGEENKGEEEEREWECGFWWPWQHPTLWWWHDSQEAARGEPQTWYHRKRKPLSHLWWDWHPACHRDHSQCPTGFTRAWDRALWHWQRQQHRSFRCWHHPALQAVSEPYAQVLHPEAQPTGLCPAVPHATGSQ